MNGMTILFRGYIWSLVGYDDGAVKLLESATLRNVAMDDPEPWPVAGDVMPILLTPAVVAWPVPVEKEIDWQTGEMGGFESRLVHLQSYVVNDIGYTNHVGVAFVPETKRWYVKRSRPSSIRP